MNRIGELAAIGAALSWTVNSLALERLGRGFSPWALNVMGKFFGLIAVSMLALALNGTFLPRADSSQWTLLLLSGFVGFSIGDVFLFHAFQSLGARRTMLVFSANPVISAVLGWVLLGETVGWLHIGGIVLAVSGIMLVIRSDVPPEDGKAHGKALLHAVLATLGQAGGVLLSKAGLRTLDPVTAAQMRLVGGVLGMALLLSVFRKWKTLPQLALSRRGWKMIGLNVVLGTLIGMVLSLLAIKNTQVAVASILTSLTPVMILPISAIFLHEKVTLYEAAGAGVTVLGVALLFL
ncbi:MAG TPA: DMT family transporter [Candidatus Limnocylindria bacterium]|nr:DMT family transporter [Candidatus Limnocylindria bacterium]